MSIFAVTVHVSSYLYTVFLGRYTSSWFNTLMLTVFLHKLDTLVVMYSFRFKS